MHAQSISVAFAFAPQTVKHIKEEYIRFIGAPGTENHFTIRAEAFDGSGMHTHQSLWKKGSPLFFDEAGYGRLSDIARYYIGGILHHAPFVLPDAELQSPLGPRL